jgi:hypothetical protein
LFISVPLLFIFIRISIRVFCALLFRDYNNSLTGNAIWLLVHNVSQKYADKNDFNDSTTGPEKEK